MAICGISLQDPAYLTEMHEVTALLFSLLPILNCKPTSLTFDFYLKIRKVQLTSFLFSVTRRSRSDVSQSVSESLTLRTELTDVTLVSEDTYCRLYR